MNTSSNRLRHHKPKMAIYDIPRGHPSTTTISILLPTSTLTIPPKKRLSISYGHVYLTLGGITHIKKLPFVKEPKAVGVAGGKRVEWRLGDEFMLDAFGPAGDQGRSAGGASRQA